MPRTCADHTLFGGRVGRFWTVYGGRDETLFGSMGSVVVSVSVLVPVAFLRRGRGGNATETETETATETGRGFGFDLKPTPFF